MLALSRERVRLEGEREKKDGQCKRREVGGRGWETEVRGSERGGGEERGERGESEGRERGERGEGERGEGERGEGERAEGEGEGKER